MPAKKRRGRPLSENWIPSPEMAAVLGISLDLLSDLLKEMKPGFHYRIVSRMDAKRATYRYHRKRVEELMENRTKKLVSGNPNTSDLDNSG